MRSDFDNNNSLMERKLKAYREYYIAEQKREAEERKEQLRIAKKLAAEAKNNPKNKRKNDGDSILKSSLSRKSGSMVLKDNNSGNIKTPAESN